MLGESTLAPVIEPEPLTLLVIVDNAPDAPDDLFIWHGQAGLQGAEPRWAGAEGRWMPLAHDWRERCKPVPAGLKEMFGGASRFLPMVVRNLPKGETGFLPLGWRLPP